MEDDSLTKKMVEVIQALADNGFKATRYSLIHAMKMHAKCRFAVLEPTDCSTDGSLSHLHEADEVYKNNRHSTNNKG
jgi:hypothetical protein